MSMVKIKSISIPTCPIYIDCLCENQIHKHVCRQWKKNTFMECIHEQIWSFKFKMHFFLLKYNLHFKVIFGNLAYLRLTRWFDVHSEMFLSYFNFLYTNGIQILYQHISWSSEENSIQVEVK